MREQLREGRVFALMDRAREGRGNAAFFRGAALWENGPRRGTERGREEVRGGILSDWGRKEGPNARTNCVGDDDKLVSYLGRVYTPPVRLDEGLRV